MLRKIFQNKFSLIFFGFVVIVLFLALSSKYLFPGDILNYIPAFSQNNWERPHNSLLGDPVYQFEPWRHFAKEKLLSGEFPLWNDLNGAGTPFFANSISAVLYPLNFIYYLFPLSISLNTIPLLKVLIFFWFTYLYIRKIGGSKLSSAIAAMIASTSGFFAVWLLWPHTNVFLLFPAMLLFTEQLRNRKKPIYYILTSLAYCAAIFGGHPETLFYMTIIHLSYSFVRLEKQTFIKIFLSIILGYFLGAVQLLPFLEYLFNSYAFVHRINTVVHNVLPIQSILTNFFPFLFGAPHTLFYKSFFPYSNFQEYIGGYIGFVPLVLVSLNIYRFKQEAYRLWVGIVVVCLFISYGIFPLNLINKLPLFSVSANQRLIGFVGFGLVVLFSYILDLILSKKIEIPQTNKIPERIVWLLSGVLLATVIILYPHTSIVDYYEFYVSLLFLSCALFLLFLKHNGKFKSALLFIAIFVQSGFLFINYVPLTKNIDYYSQTPLIKKLQQLSRGRILEVGNPSIYKNINLIYGIESAQSDDAIEVGSYRQEFDKSFPIQNMWSNPDNVTLVGLKNFAIKYVISDYNINYVSDKLQSKDEKIVKLTNDKKISIPFVASGIKLKQIRVLTANYNRLNTCKLKLEILDIPNSSVYVDCKQIRDHMFFTASLSDISLANGKEYVLQVSSPDGSIGNSIGLWANDKGKPYVEVLYANGINLYKLLYSDSASYLFEVPGINIIAFDGKYSVLQNETSKLTIQTDFEKGGVLKVYKTFYPGWSAIISGINSSVSKDGAFMSIIVPKGESYITILYQPVSFYLGLIVSILSFIFTITYLLRVIYTSKKGEKIYLTVKRIFENASFNLLVISAFLSLVFSTTLWLLMIRLNLFKFSYINNDVISWFSVHKYPKQQDYVYYVFALVTVSIIGIIAWVWILDRLKNKK